MIKDFGFYVKCNDKPLTLVNVIAKNYDEAIEFAKSSYAAQYSIYADERQNKWTIKPSGNGISSAKELI